MTSINLVLRPSLKPGRSFGSLTLRLIHERQVKSITLKDCRLYTDEWDKNKQLIIYPSNDTLRANYLRQVEERCVCCINKLQHYLNRLQKQGRYSVDELVRLYRQDTDQHKLGRYVEFLACEMEERGQLRTAKAYRTVVRGLIAFNRGQDIPLEQINSRLIKDFETYLKNLGRLPNTISYYMRNLRSIYNKAIEGNLVIRLHKENPFRGVYTGVTKTMKRALNLEEVKKIHDLDFYALLQDSHRGSGNYARIKNLEVARGYFLFRFYARGMCFVDLAHLKKSNIREGVLRYVRKKTGRQIEVRITAQMQSIIDSFAPEVKNSVYVFPIIQIDKPRSGSNKETRLQYETALRTQNNRLKELATLAGIAKNLSTHIARHTWATISKQRNVPLPVISECLGHSSEKVTQIYLNLLDNSLLDEANERVVLAVGRPVPHWGPFSRI